MMVPYATKECSTPSEGKPEEVDAEITEEEEAEERVNDEVLEHPTRDDLHEQRERDQEYEGVVHARFHIVRIRRYAT
jgi:hypothetical protein